MMCRISCGLPCAQQGLVEAQKWPIDVAEIFALLWQAQRTSTTSPVASSRQWGLPRSRTRSSTFEPLHNAERALERIGPLHDSGLQHAICDAHDLAGLGKL